MLYFLVKAEFWAFKKSQDGLYDSNKMGRTYIMSKSPFAYKVGPLLVVNRVNFTPINGLEKWVSLVFFFTPISGVISSLFFWAHLVALELSDAFCPAA